MKEVGSPKEKVAQKLSRMMDQLLTVEVVAQHLVLETRTVYNGLSNRKRGLPHPAWADLGWIRMGTRVRLPLSELQRYLAELSEAARAN